MAELKNTIVSGTDAIQLPVGTTAQRPGSPAVGMMRFNTSQTMLETYNGTRWAYNPPVITNGLVCWLDAAEPASYPGSGTTWTDLSGNGNHCTLYNGVTYSSANGGVLQFAAASTQYGRVTTFNLSSGTSTVIAAARYSGTTNSRIISSNNNWLLGHWSNSVYNYYAEGWVAGAGVGGTDTSWRIYAGTGNSTTDQWGFYINGSINTGPNNSGSQGPNGLYINATGYSGSPTELSDSQVSFVLVYNRVLAGSEIAQIYNAYRRRFGI